MTLCWLYCCPDVQYQWCCGSGTDSQLAWPSKSLIWHVAMVCGNDCQLPSDWNCIAPPWPWPSPPPPAVLRRRQLYGFVVVLKRGLPVRVVLPFVGRGQVGGRHAALAERRGRRGGPLFVQRGPLVLEQPLLEQLLLEPGLVQRISVRIVEPLGHGRRRRPGRHVLAAPVLGPGRLLPVGRHLFVVGQTALVQHLERLVFLLHATAAADRQATAVVLLLLLQQRRPGRRRLHPVGVGHHRDGRGRRGHDRRVDLVHKPVGRPSALPEADRRHVVRGARSDAVAGRAVVVRQERGASVPRRRRTAVGAATAAAAAAAEQMAAGHLQVRLVLLQVGRALQVIRQVLAVALDHRAAADAGHGPVSPGPVRLVQLRGAGRRGRVLQVRLDALVRRRGILRRHHGHVIQPVVVAHFRAVVVRRHVDLVVRFAALELGQLGQLSERRVLLLRRLAQVGQVDGMLHGPALAVRPRPVGRRVPAVQVHGRAGFGLFPQVGLHVLVAGRRAVDRRPLVGARVSGEQLRLFVREQLIRQPPVLQIVATVLLRLLLLEFLQQQIVNGRVMIVRSAGISAIVPGRSLGASSNIQGCLFICSTVYLLFGSNMSILRINDSQPHQVANFPPIQKCISQYYPIISVYNVSVMTILNRREYLPKFFSCSCFSHSTVLGNCCVARQVSTALLYIRGWSGPRTRLFEAKLMENLVLNFLTLDINTNNFMNFELQNNLQIFMILTNFCQNFELQMLIKKNCAYKNLWRTLYQISKLSYKRKKFYDFSTSKLLANFRVFDRFPTIKTTHQEPCIKFSKLFGHPKIFYRLFKKNFSKKSKISVIPLTLTFGENFKYFQ
ncbi:hypothetical protein AGLY_000882 [Aphis glycines]|uniref:Uncharacterized protein n=1 Tax=Aphis glycines TaxID=307491 RepID=A0A6G0U9R8_APHGL|nr:hypothetical protein AGLY_000882 [Aphis glycines]